MSNVLKTLAQIAANPLIGNQQESGHVLVLGKAPARPIPARAIGGGASRASPSLPLCPTPCSLLGPKAGAV